MLDSKNATGLLWLGSIKTLNSGEPRVLRVVGKYVVLHGSLHRESTESRDIRLNRSLFVSGSDVLKGVQACSMGTITTVYICTMVL